MSKYNRITVDVSPTACCGMYEVHNFNYDFGVRNIFTGSVIEHPKVYETKQEVFNSLSQQIFTKLYKRTNSDNNYKSGGYLLTAVLVTRDRFAKQALFPELAEYFEYSGWEEAARWCNKNTGNDLSLWTYFMSYDEYSINKRAYYDFIKYIDFCEDKDEDA